MQQILDAEKFEQSQEAFVHEVLEQVRFKLAQGGITGDQLRDLTGEIGFSVTSTIDGQAMIEHDGAPVHPHLSFIGEEGEVIHCGENSYAHELVADMIGKMFTQ